MKIKLQEALDLIDSADVVKLVSEFGNWINLTVSTSCIENKPDNQVLYVSWYDSDGFCFSLKVDEGLNAEVERTGNSITFTDIEGNLFTVHLFKEVPILP